MRVGFTGRPLTIQTAYYMLPPDPTFTAIEAEREAYAGYLATGEVQTRMNKQNPFPSPKGEALDRRKNAKRLAHPSHKAWWAEYKKAEDVHTASAQEFWAAREAFLKTRPITVAGLRVFVDHIDGPFTHGSAGEAFWDEEEMELAVPTLIAAVRSLVVRS
jgi:hypothetical protein